MRISAFFLTFTAVWLALSAAGCNQTTHRPPVITPVPPFGPTHPKPTPRPTEPFPAPGYTIPAPSKSLFGVTIVVDPGHGGKDPGAPARSPGQLPEKTIVLDIANRLADHLKEAHAQVIQTRSDDHFVELDDRAAISNRFNTDLFISIHADAAKNRTASGVTLYVEKNAYPQTLAIARQLQNTLNSEGFTCRGIQRADYRVLKNNLHPAVLVECGFMTNPNDAEMLNSQWYREKIAAALAQGIASHFGSGR